MNGNSIQARESSHQFENLKGHWIDSSYHIGLDSVNQQHESLFYMQPQVSVSSGKMVKVYETSHFGVAIKSLVYVRDFS